MFHIVVTQGVVGITVCPANCPNDAATCKGVHLYGSRGQSWKHQRTEVQVKQHQLHITRPKESYTKQQIKQEPELFNSSEDQFIDLSDIELNRPGTSNTPETDTFFLENLVNNQLNNGSPTMGGHLSEMSRAGLSGIKSPDQSPLNILDNRFMERLFPKQSFGHTQSISSKTQVEAVVQELKRKLEVPTPVSTRTCVTASKLEVM